MKQSESLNEIASALCEAQYETNNAQKDATNPFYKSSYSTLASVREAVREPFHKNGLSVTQTIGRDEHGIVINTTLLHKSGQWISGALSVKPVKDDPQGIGSAISYARRYSLLAIAGIASEDDDAETAQGRGEKGETKKAVELPTKPTPVPAMPFEVEVLKPDEIIVMTRKIERVEEPPAGKRAKRVYFVGDPTMYWTMHNMSRAGAGDTIDCEIKCNEMQSGSATYSIEEYNKKESK